MSKTNKSFYAILGILGFGSMSGYSIKTWVDKGVGFFWDVDYKQIYPTLKKLVEEELATFIIEKSAKRPDSKIYTLTEKGHCRLKAWLNEPIKPGRQSANELKLKLFFGHHVSLKKNLEHLKKFKEETARGLNAIKEIEKCFVSSDNKDASWHYRRTTVMNGEITKKATLEWCDKAIKYLEDSLKP